MSKQFHVVAKTDEIAPGTSKRISLRGREIALFNLAGTFFALNDRCPHESGSLCAGKIVGLAASDEPGHYKLLRDGEFVKCPWHGWEFDIRTGQSWCDPTKTKVRTYDAQVAAGADVVKGPYVAETFPVSVENDYIVIEL
jgi:nitrite reductase/ring-hydroxylating ferredoxin subunit